MSKKWKRYDRHSRYQGYTKQSNGEAWVKAAEDWNKTYKENYEN